MNCRFNIALLLLCIVLSILSPYFLKVRNFMNVLSYVSISGVMSAGLTVVMLMGCMDLSQYSVMAMIGMYLGIMLERGVNPFLTIICALVLGAAAGCINAFMVTKMQVPPIIATIGSQLVARSVAYLSTNGSYPDINNGRKNMKDFSIELIWTKVQMVATLIGGWLGYFLGGLDGLLIALIIFMVLDYITGLMCAVIDKKLSSAVGFRGICKKVLILMLVGLANVIDMHVVGTGSALRGAVIAFYLSNEGLSLLENAAHIGLPVPEKMKEVLAQLHGRGDDQMDD